MAGILDWLKNWSKSNKERHDMSSFFEEEKPKAHDSIDTLMVLDTLNQIDPSTIQETRRGLSPFGLNMNALYEGLTKGGEPREIFRQGYPDYTDDKEGQSAMLSNLLKELRMNPSFADTVTAETRHDIKAELDYSGKPLRYLKRFLGF